MLMFHSHAGHHTHTHTHTHTHSLPYVNLVPLSRFLSLIVALPHQYSTDTAVPAHRLQLTITHMRAHTHTHTQINFNLHIHRNTQAQLWSAHTHTHDTKGPTNNTLPIKESGS